MRYLDLCLSPAMPVSALIGLYSVIQARELGASRWLQARMVGNLLLDAAIGAVPVAGDVADIFFRAHRRNLRLLQRELKEPWIEWNWIVRHGASLRVACTLRKANIGCHEAYSEFAPKSDHDSGFTPLRPKCRRGARSGESMPRLV